MKKNNIVAVLDVGSAKVCCCIADVSKENFKMLGVGYCACVGVKSGIIVDMKSVERSIAKAVEVAERMANFTVRSVYVNISGRNVLSRIVTITMNLGGRIVYEEDLAHLLTHCNEEDESSEVIHSVSILYCVDSLNCIKDPVGMMANQLSVSVNLVTAPKSQLHNLLICLARCHLEVIGVVASGYASGLCLTEENDSQDNQIVVDFGGGTTTIAFFYKGIFCGLESIALGGEHITADVAYGLNISTTNAERLKTLHGAAFTSITDNRDMIFAPVIEDDDVINLQQIPKSALNQIIQPRIEEILGLVKKKIDDSLFGPDFSRCVAITGGGSVMAGLRDLASGLLNKKIRFKKIDDFLDGSDVQIGNNFSVALGMVKFAQLSDRLLVKTKSSASGNKKAGFFRKTMNWVENNL
ncbi:MAG: cell division protein FtsA [Holosporaceae bacterium]|jgi:cell division protein FtsA|nr:cell division protein FtsA [Holosporaceae bacterium]